MKGEKEKLIMNEAPIMYWELFVQPSKKPVMWELSARVRREN